MRRMREGHSPLCPAAFVSNPDTDCICAENVPDRAPAPIASIGRVVHYRLTADDCILCLISSDRIGELCKLDVTAVHADGKINGGIMVHGISTLWAEGIPIATDPDQLGAWFWPARV